MCPWSTVRKKAKKKSTRSSAKKKSDRYIPEKYQKKGIKRIIKNGAAGLLWDPGLGKTSTYIAAFKILQKEGLVDALVVIAPLRVCFSTWNPENPESDFAKFKDFRDFKVNIVHGPDKMEKLKEDADIYIMNPEFLKLLTKKKKVKGKKLSKSYNITKEARKILKDKGTLMLLVDESTKFKYSNTHRFKRLKELLPLFQRRYIATGTPIPRSLIDLFGQVYILDMGSILGRNITAYRQTHFDSSGFGGHTYTIRQGSEKQIIKQLSPLLHRLDAEDYIDLPPKIERDIKLELPSKVRDLYDEMEEEFIIELRRGEIKASNAGVKSTKLRQIANGGIYYEDRTIEHLHDEKTEATLDLVEQLSGQPTLIAYDTHHDLERLKKALGKDTPHIGGGVSVKRGVEIEAAWNRGEIETLLGHPQSIAHGINLQKTGRAIIWHSLTWNLEDYIQFIRRIWRRGQEGNVFVYHLLVRNTIDIVIRRSIDHKNSTQKAFLDELKKAYL